MKEMHYFISLEKELEDSFNYIEPENDNLKCYGAKFTSLLNSVSIEFESLSKALIKYHRPSAKVGNIGEIKQNLLELFPNIGENEVEITRINESRIPFKEWGNGSKLEWWDAFTSIKHNRIKNYSLASLNNVLDSMAALIVIILYIGWFRDENYHLKSSGIFWHKSMGDSLLARGENIPDVNPKA
ncbi:hypothetical protein [Methylotuvimicrobium sp. KM1]|uniref:hypothetical protein n=1 Tax=Methylotuvimicrobium sp. KM1 TaxID=3377707 RepID=UPI00384CF66E